VLRDLRTADRWRELDTVTMHCPRVGLNNARVQVLGYIFVEGEGQMDLVGDQYPIGMLDPGQRHWWSTVAALSEGGNLLSVGTGGAPFDPTYGQPNLINASSGRVAITGIGGECDCFFRLANNDTFFLKCDFSFHIEGPVAMKIYLLIGNVALSTAALGNQVFGAGDYGPFSLLPDIQSAILFGDFAGTAILQAVNTNGNSGFMSSQVDIYEPTRAA
jgi:hypothetical protein